LLTEAQALAKFAHVCYAVHELLQNPKLAQSGLDNLKTAFNRFALNRQQFPLIYECKLMSMHVRDADTESAR
jgi:endo-1,3(4)-beta-glucanase